MNNIEKMDSLFAKWFIDENKMLARLLRLMCDQHKDHIDRMAQLETQIAELIREDDSNIKPGGTD